MPRSALANRAHAPLAPDPVAICRASETTASDRRKTVRGRANPENMVGIAHDADRRGHARWRARRPRVLHSLGTGRAWLRRDRIGLTLSAAGVFRPRLSFCAFRWKHVRGAKGAAETPSSTEVVGFEISPPRARRLARCLSEERSSTILIVPMQRFIYASRRIVAVAGAFVALGYGSNGVSARQCQIATAQRLGDEILGRAQRIGIPRAVYVTPEDMSRHPDSEVVLLRADLAVLRCTPQYANTECWPRAFVARSEWILPWILNVNWGWQSGPGVGGIQRTTRGRGARTRFFSFFGLCVRLWDANGWYMQSA